LEISEGPLATTKFARAGTPLSVDEDVGLSDK